MSPLGLRHSQQLQGNHANTVNIIVVHSTFLPLLKVSLCQLAVNSNDMDALGSWPSAFFSWQIITALVSASPALSIDTWASQEATATIRYS